MGALEEGYANWLAERRLSQNTIDQRLRFVDRQLRAWGTLDVPAATVARWLNSYTGWTLYTYYHHAKSAYDYLVESGAIATHPMTRMQRPPIPKNRGRSLPPDLLTRVLTSCAGDLSTWMHLAFLAGLRASEISMHRGEHITAQAVYILGKGGQADAVPTHPTIWDIAQQYPRRGWWFPDPKDPRRPITPATVSRRTARYFRSLGIDKGAGHRLRHTYANTLKRNGVHPRVIQELLRHASLNTTQIYLDVEDDEKTAAIHTLVA